jgi:hypothetical protein
VPISHHKHIQKPSILNNKAHKANLRRGKGAYNLPIHVWHLNISPHHRNNPGILRCGELLLDSLCYFRRELTTPNHALQQHLHLHDIWCYYSVQCAAISHRKVDISGAIQAELKS